MGLTDPGLYLPCDIGGAIRSPRMMVPFPTYLEPHNPKSQGRKTTSRSTIASWLITPRIGLKKPQANPYYNARGPPCTTSKPRKRLTPCRMKPVGFGGV